MGPGICAQASPTDEILLPGLLSGQPRTRPKSEPQAKEGVLMSMEIQGTGMATGKGRAREGKAGWKGAVY